MKPVFADAFFYIALLNEDDKAHMLARQFAAGLDRKLVTTPWVLVEAANSLCGIKYRGRCEAFVRALYADRNLEIVHCTELLLRSGLNLFRDRPDKESSLADCISFVVMKQKRLTHALTGDHHFKQAGFVALLKKD